MNGGGPGGDSLHLFQIGCCVLTYFLVSSTTSHLLIMNCPKTGQSGGSCPFLHQDTKRNPALLISQEGFSQSYISPYKFQLQNRFMAGQNPRTIFNGYPKFLQNSLFYDQKELQQVRTREPIDRYVPSDHFRQQGNQRFIKKEYEAAIQSYEVGISMFRWLQYVPEPQNQQISQKERQLRKLFRTFHDANTRLHDGQEVTAQRQQQLRRNLLMQLFINLTAAHIYLNHFQQALMVASAGLQLCPNYSIAAFRKAQALALNKGAILSQLLQAERLMVFAIQRCKSQKIFESSERIRRMLSVDGHQQAYNELLKLVRSRLQIKQHKVDLLKKQIKSRYEEIVQNQKNIISRGLVPKQSFRTDERGIEGTDQMRTMRILIEKYNKVKEFHLQSKKQDQVVLASQQLQKTLETFVLMKQVSDLQILCQNRRRVESCKMQVIQDIYNGGFFNIQMLEWAIKQLVKQEKALKKESPVQSLTAKKQLISWKWLGLGLLLVLALVYFGNYLK